MPPADSRPAASGTPTVIAPSDDATSVGSSTVVDPTGVFPGRTADVFLPEPPEVLLEAMDLSSVIFDAPPPAEPDAPIQPAVSPSAVPEAVTVPWSGAASPSSAGPATAGPPVAGSPLSDGLPGPDGSLGAMADSGDDEADDADGEDWSDLRAAATSMSVPQPAAGAMQDRDGQPDRGVMEPADAPGSAGGFGSGLREPLTSASSAAATASPARAGGIQDDAAEVPAPARVAAPIARADLSGPDDDGDPVLPLADPAAAVDPKLALEAILFAAHEPLAPARLGALVGELDGKTVRRMVAELNESYSATGRVFRIEEIAGGFQILTLPAFNPWLRKLFRSRAENKLGQPAMLSLAIIAYKQPIKRLDIESIRGAACGDVLRQLMDRGLVKIVGREETLGRPLLYGTTNKFLQTFGLASLKELPRPEEFQKP